MTDPPTKQNEKQAYDVLLRMNQTLQLLATEKSLGLILEDVVLAVESQIQNSRGSILILDEACEFLSIQAGPNMPEDFRAATKKFPVGENMGACGRAAFLNEAVFIPDIQKHPTFAPLKETAQRYNMHAAWSLPVRNVDGKVMGTLCMYKDEIREPREDELQIIQSFANIAGIAIQNEQARKDFQASEVRFKKLFEQVYFIMGRTASLTGDEFFRELIKSLASTLNLKTAFIGEYIDGKPPSIRTRAFYNDGEFADNFEYKISGTPCETVLANQSTMFYESGVQDLFPHDQDLKILNVESYGGICLENDQGKNIGILSVMDSIPFTNSDNINILISVFSSRVKAELMRLHIEEEILQARMESERSNEAKSEFLARMSHELRTPLNAILGFSQLMEIETTLSEKQAKNLAQISRAGEHLLELINEVLDLSKIDSGIMTFSLESICLHNLLEEVVLLLTPLARKQEIEIKLDSQQQSGVFVVADRLRLNQIMMNLVSNAIKYNLPKGKVILSHEEIPDHRIRIKVDDTGPGIEPEKLERVFQPFERLEHEFSVVQGTGIGLTIAHKLAEKMNGKLSAKSIPGEGSCFYVEMPKGEAPPEIDKRPREDLPAISETENSPSKTVLYIEDNKVNIELVKQIFGLKHVNFVFAMTGEDGIKLAKNCEPDLILLDIHLPGMNGIEVFKVLRQMETLDSVPIFAVTANAMNSDRQTILEVGFNKYFTKPFDIKEFSEAVTEVLDFK